MSRKKRGGRGPDGAKRSGGSAVPPAAGRPAPRPDRSPRAWLIAGLALAISAMALAYLASLANRGAPTAPAPGGGERVPLPPPPAAAPAAEPGFADFAGAEACAGCHAREHDAWRASTHGRAGRMPPAADVVFAPFGGAPIRFRDAVVYPRAEAGGLAFVVERDGEPPTRLRVDGVVGGGHMAGGGTQGFVTRWPDGTLRFLPFEVERRDTAWFCNTSTRLNRGWRPITPDMRLADCGDWPPVRVLGASKVYASCQECHGSQIQLAFDPERRAYETRLKSLAIDCEACHGPAGRHIASVRAGGDVAMSPLATLSKEASVRVCLRCHALKDVVRPGYLPGKSLETYYSLALPLLGDTAVHADGRTRTFAYQQGHLSSDCYLNGSMTCVDCHDPHTQRYRTISGAPLPGRLDDGQCLGCHPSKADRVAEHSHHPAASAGSRCVSCHMPYVQEREVGGAVRYLRSDHTISIPRPAVDSALGIPSACRACHADRAEGRLQGDVDRWYGTLKPRPPLVEALARAGELRSEGDAARRLLDPGARGTMTQFAALAAFLERWLRPDMPALDREAADRLRRLAASRDLDVRALALASLHWARGEDPETHRFLAVALRSLGADDAPLRGRWALVLGYLGDEARVRGDARAALVAYSRALEIEPDEPPILVNAGLAAADGGDHAAAIALYRRALARDPAVPLGWVNLGLSLQAAGDTAGAREAFVRDTIVNGFEPLGHVNLGNMALRAGEPARAAAEYERAAAIAPGLGAAHLNLARAYLLLGDLARARLALRRGLDFEPGDTAARTALAQVEEALGERARR
ncbi:MAG TPA: tetratricopeptide repeat protein [Longimicrobiales bacterium]|nr:tetratricopeptide repeat protein [Longimicrobiales bacterium]